MIRNPPEYSSDCGALKFKAWSTKSAVYKPFVELLSALLHLDAQGDNFLLCIAVQNIDEHLIVVEEAMVKQKEVLESEDPAAQTLTVFKMKVEEFQDELVPRIYNIHPVVKILQHLSVEEWAIHFGLKRLPVSEMLRLLDYMLWVQTLDLQT